MDMMSLRFTTALLIICTALVGQSSASLFNWWFKNREIEITQREYTLLNSELVKNVKDNAALPNIVAAVEWLKMRSEEKEEDPRLVRPSVKTLSLFTSLVKLMDPEHSFCNMTGYTILKENELATGTDISQPPSELGAVRRIDDVVHRVAVDHAAQCRYVYPAKFAKALNKAPPDLIRGIRDMMKAIIGTSKKLVFVPKDRPTDWRQVDSCKAQDVSMRGMEEAKALLLYLRECSKEDENTSFLFVLPNSTKRNYYLVNEPEVVNLMQRYVYSRCEILKKRFGHIIIPAVYDQEFSEYKYRAINDQVAEFMIWLQYYRICQDIMQNNKKLEDNVLEAIWSEFSVNSYNLKDRRNWFKY